MHVTCLSLLYLPFKITIPAVKITGSATFCPLPPISDSLLSPEPCVSEHEIKLEPIDSTLFPCPADHQAEGGVLSDQHADPEFGEFLLDEVNSIPIRVSSQYCNSCNCGVIGT